MSRAVTTINHIFDSVDRTHSVQKVTLASCIYAIMTGPKDHPQHEQHVYAEDDWARAWTPSFPYGKAKVEVERIAWEREGHQVR